MKDPHLLNAIRQSVRSKPPDDFDQAMREVRPFYWFLIAGLAIQYVFSLYYFPDLRTPFRLIAFTGLIVLHGLLHWWSPHLTYKTVLTLPYLLLQCGLAFLLILISDSPSLTYGLYGPLLGEYLGMFLRTRSVIPGGLLILAASLGSYLVVNGLALPWEWLLTTIPLAVFIWFYVSLFTRQVRAREQAQVLLAKLENTHRQLAEYAAQVEDLTITNERQRMARELHDTLAQGLAGLILQLEAADSRLSTGHSEKAQAIIQRAMGSARSTLADARQAIGDLRASPTTPHQLTAAIRAQAGRFTNSTGIPIELKLCEPEKITPKVAENVLGAISEGLINIANHAQASSAAITMVCRNNALSVEITDNGVGFDPAESVGRSGHFGLLGIRERARIVGGSLAIKSQPSRGTTLKIDLPVVAKGTHDE